MSGTLLTASLDGMTYYVVLPPNYSPTQQYPVLLFLHGGGQESEMPGLADAWFDTAAFQSAYPSIIVEPVLANASATTTWGGYPNDGSSISTNTVGENDALAILAQVMSQYSVDPNRVYVTGLSLGGYATWDLMIKYNAYDGTEGRIFAAGMPVASDWEGLSGPSTAIASELENVPIWAIDNGNDLFTGWDPAMVNALGPDSAYHYTDLSQPGEDAWDSVYPLPEGAPYYDWLFSQYADLVTTSGDALSVEDTTTESTVTPTITAYSGPVAGLQNEYINVTSDSLNISADSPNWFIHSGAGNDAIALSSGTNVVDGGTGSNFLTSGNGTDTFFVDDRSAPAAIWSTISNFHAGDSVTVWGITPQNFSLSWVNGQGASGYTGLTLHATAAGVPTASFTLVGFSTADMSSGRLSVSFGTVDGNNYMYVHDNW